MFKPPSRGINRLGYDGRGAGTVFRTGEPSHRFGGVIPTAAVATAGGALSPETGSNDPGEPTFQAASESLVAQGADGLPSAQFLEAPLNGIISAWLEQNAPTVDALFKVTGLKPLQLVDRLVTGLRNRGAPATSENINSVALDIMDSAPERAALRHDIFEHKETQELHVVDPGSAVWSNTRAAIAIIQTAAELFPSGIHGVVALREALFMNPQDFDAAVRHIYARDLSAEYGDMIEDRSQRVRVLL